MANVSSTVYGYIYAIENLINGKMYVGQTIDLERRKKQHFSPSSKRSYICDAIQKYGKDNFDFCLIEACRFRDELNSKEIYWIKELNTMSSIGYNLTPGGESMIFSDEIRQKISKSRVGVKNPMYGLSGNKSPTFGRKHTDLVKQKISAVHKGKIISEEVRKKMRISHEGLHIGPENPFFGKEHSKESREKMSKASKGRKFSKKHKNNLRKAALLRWQKRKTLNE